MKTYKLLSDQEKQTLIHNLYVNENKSFAEIASILDTYPNKIRRDAVKFDIKPRNKAEAQKLALSLGKTSHPTQGKQRTLEEKAKIGEGVYKSWSDMPEQVKEQRKKNCLKQWNSLDDNHKKNMIQKANSAVREASKKGSKLERFFLQKLLADNYKVDFHKEQTLVNTKLQIDLFLPTMNIAIEIDGPSHFDPIWGQDALSKNKKYDSKKTGLILGKGWSLIRVKQTKDFSPTYAQKLYEKTLDCLKNGKNIKNKEIIIEE